MKDSSDLGFSSIYCFISGRRRCSSVDSTTSAFAHGIQNTFLLCCQSCKVAVAATVVLVVFIPVAVLVVIGVVIVAIVVVVVVVVCCRFNKYTKQLVNKYSMLFSVPGCSVPKGS